MWPPQWTIVPTAASGPGLGPADDWRPPLGAGPLLHGLDFSSAYIGRNQVPGPEGEIGGGGQGDGDGLWLGVSFCWGDKAGVSGGPLYWGWAWVLTGSQGSFHTVPRVPIAITQ